jgi:hypothetical protein
MAGSELESDCRGVAGRLGTWSSAPFPQTGGRAHVPPNVRPSAFTSNNEPPEGQKLASWGRASLAASEPASSGAGRGRRRALLFGACCRIQAQLISALGPLEAS